MKKRMFMFRKKTIERISVLFLVSLFLLFPAFRVEAVEKEEVDEIIAMLPSDWPKLSDIPAATAILMEAKTGEILYAKNATEAMYPASTEKLMTALLTLENCLLNEIVDFPFAAVDIPAGSSHIGMRRGEKMVLSDCLYGLLLPSANEVANALALHVSGTIPDFVMKMNSRAFELGAVNTRFVNANGLHDEKQHTCAYDLALFLRECIKNDVFVTVSSTVSFVHHADELLNKDIPMTNTHLMLKKSSEYYYPYAICGKTGHTAESGYNLVTYAEKDNTSLISVVMGCEDGAQYVATKALLDYGFNSFTEVLPAALDPSLSFEKQFTASPLQIPTVPVALLFAESSGSILVPSNVTFDMLEKKTETAEGTIMITYLYKGYPLGTVALKKSTESEELPIFGEEEVKIEVIEKINLVVIDGWVIVSIVAMIILFLVVLRLLKNWYIPKKNK